LRRYILFGVGGIAGLAALYVGVMWLTLWRFQVSTDNAAVQADIATISAKLSGYVAEVNVADNQAVRRGDVLMTLDTSDIRPRVDQARATVDAKRAAIKNIDAKLILQHAMIAQAQSSVVSAQADAARGGKDLTRYQQLARRGYASGQKLETTRADADRFSAGVTHARAALEAERDGKVDRYAEHAELAFRPVPTAEVPETECRNTGLRGSDDLTHGFCGVLFDAAQRLFGP